jgi:predicted  nucleic acid-binding Zn-ribbon protein
MSEAVVQWLNEIKALKQNVADLQQALTDSNASADRWRQLYETEAQQRRQEADQWQAKMEALHTTIAQLQTPVDQSELAQERDRLRQELAAEKASHEQTRKSLTTALADAMEILSPPQKQLPDAVD